MLGFTIMPCPEVEFGQVSAHEASTKGEAGARAISSSCLVHDLAAPAPDRYPARGIPVWLKISAGHPVARATAPESATSRRDVPSSAAMLVDQQSARIAASALPSQALLSPPDQELTWRSVVFGPAR